MSDKTQEPDNTEIKEALTLVRMLFSTIKEQSKEIQNQGEIIKNLSSALNKINNNN